MNAADLFAPAFELGQVVATRDVMSLVGRGLMLDPYLARHHAGDWGEVSAGDAAANDGGLSCGDRLLSAYSTPFGKIWIVTEADRSSTCVLLPREY